MKYIVLIIATALTTIASAQSGKVISAWKYLSDFKNSKDTSSLTKAKDAIDLASENPDTKNEAKTWVYRGMIYQTIYEQNLKAEIENIKDTTDNNKKTLIAYQNTATGDMEKAIEAYEKAKMLDEKKTYDEELTQKMNESSRHFENRGIGLYNNKLYAEALPAFEKAIAINGLFGQTDTANINNAALVADRSMNYEKAKLYYQKLIDIQYGNGNTYSILSVVYQNIGDTAGAFDVVKKGRAAYPDDINLLISETNYYLRQKKTAEAISNLRLAIEKKTDDANLYLVLGNLYDNMANPKDDDGKDLEKPKDYEALFKLAEENYTKSIELKPDIFDALYNIGVLYNNKGVAISKKADSIQDQAKYKIENDKATEEFKKALPYLERAREVNPNDKNLLIALKQLYARTSQSEKLKEVNELLKN